jgi:DNA polymerase III epsilon subunit-like protein
MATVIPGCMQSNRDRAEFEPHNGTQIHRGSRMPMTGVVRPCQRPIGDPGVYKVLGSWEWFEDPGSSIPPEITTITGITDEMVAGHRIDDHAVYDLLSRVVLVIAHHADFDRRFLEKRNIGRAAVSRLTGKPRASGHQRSNLSPTR